MGGEVAQFRVARITRLTLGQRVPRDHVEPAPKAKTPPKPAVTRDDGETPPKKKGAQKPKLAPPSDDVGSAPTANEAPPTPGPVSPPDDVRPAPNLKERPPQPEPGLPPAVVGPAPKQEMAAPKPRPTPPQKREGPLGYRNWRAKSAGEPPGAIWEVDVYGDAHPLGDWTKSPGPYAIVNVVNPWDAPHARRTLVLREENCLDRAHATSMAKTDTSAFPGGSPADEIIALLVLENGVRLRAGGTSRLFYGRDPFGMPRSYGAREVPVLPPRQGAGVLPGLSREWLISTKLLTTYGDLSAEEAVVLARSARMYANAVWNADADANLAWLLLVSAIETAAVFWSKRRRRERDTDHISVLCDLDEKLGAMVRQVSDAALASKIAAELVDRKGIFRKFRAFIEHYLPGSPPASRPPPAGQAHLTGDEFKDSLKLIYRYRSEALHAGTPFPSPMCFPPETLPVPLEEGKGQTSSETREIPCERPLGLAASSHGGAWRAEHLPMNLHCFEYITRAVLCAWWADLPNSRPASSA